MNILIFMHIYVHIHKAKSIQKIKKKEQQSTESSLNQIVRHLLTGIKHAKSINAEMA